MSITLPRRGELVATPHFPGLCCPLTALNRVHAADAVQWQQTSPVIDKLMAQVLAAINDALSHNDSGGGDEVGYGADGVVVRVCRNFDEVKITFSGERGTLSVVDLCARTVKRELIDAGWPTPRTTCNAEGASRFEVTHVVDAALYARQLDPCWRQCTAHHDWRPRYKGPARAATRPPLEAAGHCASSASTDGCSQSAVCGDDDGARSGCSCCPGAST